MSNIDLTSPEAVAIISKFYDEVCRMAEEKMIKTGRLEGAHFASMQQLMKELKEKATPETNQEK